MKIQPSNPTSPNPAATDIPHTPDDDEDYLPAFTPVALRARADGWSPGRQEDFIHALAESGCVAEAARRVGMGVSSAYMLRARPESDSFRCAWNAAIDMAMPRMSDAAISRAIHGVPVPHFYKGEQVGEHRRYDERLTMWLLRYRDPVMYGKWLDQVVSTRHPDGAARTLRNRIVELWDDIYGLLKRRRSATGPVWRHPPPERPPE